jgi:hypothetical protein
MNIEFKRFRQFAPGVIVAAINADVMRIVRERRISLSLISLIAASRASTSTFTPRLPIPLSLAVFIMATSLGSDRACLSIGYGRRSISRRNGGWSIKTPLTGQALRSGQFCSTLAQK